MNTNIDKINEFIEKTFNSLTTKKESFFFKIKYKDYKLTISFLNNYYILFTCSTNTDYYCSSIHQKDLEQSFLNNDNKKIDLISLIKSNTLSLKEFLNLNLILVCLTENKSDETIFEFFLNKLNEKTMNNEVIKMMFKKKEVKQEVKQGDEFNKLVLDFDSGINTLDDFNKMYGLNIKGNEINIDLTYNDKKSNNNFFNSPLLKISSKGFLLFCKNKFDNLLKLILKNNDISDLNVFKYLDTKNIQSLDLSENNINNIAPLTKLNLQKLEKLILSFNQIEDISSLKDMKIPSLKDLDLSHNYIENITIIESISFPFLKSLDLSYNQINLIISFKKANFPSLEYLNLNTNLIINMNPLTNAIKKISILILNQNKFEFLDFLPKCDFIQLKEIYLYSCKISDISYLSSTNFPNLQTLSLPENNISDIAALQTARFPNLKKLSLYGNNISDISHLKYSNFPYLKELYLYKNKISDISCIAKFRFKYLSTLSLMSNQIRDISVFRYTDFNQNLEILALSQNQIKDISVFSNYSTLTFTRLKELWLDHNEINNIDNLDKGRMHNIIKIKLGHNFIQKITVIQRMNFYNLKEIDLNNNVISDLSPLLNIRMQNLKSINLSNNSFIIGNNTYTLDFLKNRGINVILQSNDK